MLEAPVPLAPDSPLHLHLLVGGERTDLDARVRGCVPRARPARRAAWGVGVQFETMGSAARERLERALGIGPRTQGARLAGQASGRGQPAGQSRDTGAGTLPGPLEDPLPGGGDALRRVFAADEGRRRAREPRRRPASPASRASAAPSAASSSATSTRRTASAGQVRLVLQVGHDRRASLRQHPQQRRRGLPRGGVAQVRHDVRGLDVRRQLGSGIRPVRTVRPRTPRRSSSDSRRFGSGTGPTSSRRSPGAPRAARATARATASGRFSGVSRPKTPTTRSLAAKPRRARSSLTARGSTATRLTGIGAHSTSASGPLPGSPGP